MTVYSARQWELGFIHHHLQTQFLLPLYAPFKNLCALLQQLQYHRAEEGGTGGRGIGESCYWVHLIECGLGAAPPVLPLTPV